MKSKVMKFALTGVMVLSISIPVFATWYQSNAVIPASGIITTARAATSTIQYTQVQNNVYNAYSRIDRSTYQALSAFQLNPAGTPTIRTHRTGMANGTMIRAEFKATGATQPIATTGIIRWEP